MPYWGSAKLHLSFAGLYLRLPFENITFTNVDMDKGVECVNVDGLRFTGGTFEEIRLSPDELKARNEDIETFRRLLY